MNTGRRRRPKHLAAKLRDIRDGLGLSQSEVIKRFGLSERLTRGKISDYERGTREPDMLTLLAYARGARVSVERIIDDNLKLPEELLAAARAKRAAERRKKIRKKQSG